MFTALIAILTAVCCLEEQKETTIEQEEEYYKDCMMDLKENLKQKKEK
jgi:hypothetical protein